LLTAVDERDDREGLPAALLFVLHGVDAQVAIGRVDKQREVVVANSRLLFAIQAEPTRIGLPRGELTSIR
jgi:hypothetical protein